MLNISYFFLAQFVAVIIYSVLILVVLRKNLKERLNLVFAGLMACFVWWGTAVLFRLANHDSLAAASYADRIGNFGWIFFPSFFLWLSLVYAKRKAADNKLFPLLLFSIPIALTIAEWLTPFSILTTKSLYDWNSGWTGSGWTYLYFAYYPIFCSIGLYYLYILYLKTANRSNRQQIILIIASAFISLVLGTIIKVFNVPMGVFSVLTSGNTFLVFWAFGTFYAVNRYKFLGPSFTLASKNIVDNMSEGLLLLDGTGEITDVNDRAVKILRADRDGLIGKFLSGYFADDMLAGINKMLADKSNLESADSEIRLEGGLSMPVRFSCSRVIGEDGDFMGWVCMIGDISQQKKDEADLDARNAELSDKLDELQRFQKIVVDRELKMMELKKEIERLKGGTVAVSDKSTG
jgi:PAS domain S-box-containing protein